MAKKVPASLKDREKSYYKYYAQDIAAAPQEKYDTVSYTHLDVYKRQGLYTVIWHPLGGLPRPEDLCRLSEAVADMEDVELRLAPDETAYIVNLTGEEAQKVLKVTEDLSLIHIWLLLCDRDTDRRRV